MQQNWIIYPLVGMALLTLYVGVKMITFRVKAVKEGALSSAYFLLNRGGKPPEYLVKTTQNYDNLMELPVLFYVVVCLVYFMGKVDYGYIALAWLFLLARILHTIIHTTYNNLLHRRNAFLFSTVFLYSMWGRMLTQLVFA